MSAHGRHFLLVSILFKPSQEPDSLWLCTCTTKGNQIPKCLESPMKALPILSLILSCMISNASFAATNSKGYTRENLTWYAKTLFNGGATRFGGVLASPIHKTGEIGVEICGSIHWSQENKKFFLQNLTYGGRTSCNFRMNYTSDLVGVFHTHPVSHRYDAKHESPSCIDYDNAIRQSHAMRTRGLGSFHSFVGTGNGRLWEFVNNRVYAHCEGRARCVSWASGIRRHSFRKVLKSAPRCLGTVIRVN